MTDERGLQTIADAVDALTHPIRVREPIYERDDHRHLRLRRVWETTVPSLLTQLRAAVQPGTTYVDDDGGHIHVTPRSTPPARLDAVNALLRIEAGVALWRLHVGLKARSSLVYNLRGLVGAPMHSDDQAALLADLRRWYGWATTLSGWQRPPWRPHAPCPACDVVGSLRVRLERKNATCVECGAIWGEGEIGLLGQHILINAVRPGIDTRALRTLAVLARRAEDERRRVKLRPDLPYFTDAGV